MRFSCGWLAPAVAALTGPITIDPPFMSASGTALL